MCQFHQGFTPAFFVRTSFFLVMFRVWYQILYEKRAHNMLMKLTARVNFTNVLLTAFTLKEPESVKKIDNLTVFFMHLGSAPIKAVRRTLMKLS